MTLIYLQYDPSIAIAFALLLLPTFLGSSRNVLKLRTFRHSYRSLQVMKSSQNGTVGISVFQRVNIINSLLQAQAAEEVLKARVGAQGIQLGVGGDPWRAVCVLV